MSTRTPENVPGIALRCLALPLLLFFTGCFTAPSPDLAKLKCTTDRQCPTGYSCLAPNQVGGCCKPNSPCPVTAVTDAADADLAPVDVSMIGETRWETGGSDGGGSPGEAGHLDQSPVPSLDAGGTDTMPDSSPDSVVDAPMGGTGGNGGATGTGGTPGSGGVSAGDGALGTGGNAGVTGTGGIAATGGMGAGGMGTGGMGTGGMGTGGMGTGGMGTGGMGTGGMGTGGALGTGGTVAVCQGSQTRCSGNALQTCANGQWGVAIACGTHQSCTGAVGSAQCTCYVDAICSSIGKTCNGSTLVTCAQDAQGCFYQSSSSTCNNGACYGSPGTALCCTNEGTVGKTCATTTTVQTCALSSTGCITCSNSTCSSGSSCSVGNCLLVDGQACTSGFDCVSSICGTFYVDGDHDGYGSATATPLRRCGATPPTNYVTDHTDCCDSDQYAHPNSTRVASYTNACGNYDWDCVNGEQKKNYDPGSSASCNSSAYCGTGCSTVPFGCTCSGIIGGDPCATYTEENCGNNVYILTYDCAASCPQWPNSSLREAGFQQECH
jgi:hypothetical protein